VGSECDISVCTMFECCEYVILSANASVISVKIKIVSANVRPFQIEVFPNNTPINFSKFTIINVKVHNLILQNIQFSASLMFARKQKCTQINIETFE
jgi:hypothetical protein